VDRPTVVSLLGVTFQGPVVSVATTGNAQLHAVILKSPHTIDDHALVHHAIVLISGDDDVVVVTVPVGVTVILPVGAALEYVGLMVVVLISTVVSVDVLIFQAMLAHMAVGAVEVLPVILIHIVATAGALGVTGITHRGDAVSVAAVRS